MMIRVHGSELRPLGMLVCVAAAVCAAGCGIIRPVRGRRGGAVHSGFLGDYSGLQKHEGYDAQEIYINPGAGWGGYGAVYLESAGLWVRDPENKLSPEDRQLLTDTLFRAMHMKLGESFELVDRPGPGVLRLRVAFTEAKGANVPLNAVTTVVPQLRTASSLVALATDSALLVGSASIEAELADSISGERLAAMVDSRAGTKGIVRAFSKWGDVEAACEYWAGRTAGFLVDRGVRTKPGATAKQTH